MTAQDTSGSDHAFCCQGCKRVWTVAAENGFDSLLAGPVTTRNRAHDASERKAAAAAAAGARREVLRVEGMWCASCSLIIEEVLLAFDGVLDVEVSYASSLARVTFDAGTTSIDEIVDGIGVLGYRASRSRDVALGDDQRDVQDLFLRFFVGAVVSMWVMWPTLFMLYPAYASGTFGTQRGVELFVGALSLTVLLYPGWPFLRGAIQAARVRRVTMDTLVAVGTWTAWNYSLWAALSGSGGVYFESAAMITTIVLLGRWLEALGRRGAGEALAGLRANAPTEVLRIRAGGSLGDAERVALIDVGPDSLIVVRAGERVPVDGVIESGRSTLDVARLTGEPMPAERSEGDEVFAGAINVTDTLVVRVTRSGGDTLLGRIDALVEDAAFAKSNAQRLADAAAAVFVPIVFAVAAATAIITAVTGPGWEAGIERGIAVLVVSCPCALGLATPLVVANAMGLGARRGLLIRGGAVLERAGDVAVLALDKTGTLTEGSPSVAGFVPAPLTRADQSELLALAAAVEVANPHPAAAAIVTAAHEDARRGVGASVSHAERIVSRPGLGVEGTVDGRRIVVGSAQLITLEGIDLPAPLVSEARAAGDRGDSVVWVASGGRLLGGVVLADRIRVEAHDTLASIRARVPRIALVSGDARATCEAVALSLPIDEVYADVLPNEKEQVVREQREQYGPVAFVGDGINDTPALAAADLAVAIGDGSDVALAASDVVMLGRPGDSSSSNAFGNGRTTGSALGELPTLLALARRGRRVIRQNMAWAFSYNVVAIPLAVAGLLSPIAAAAAMAFSSLAVVANSLRVRRVR